MNRLFIKCSRILTASLIVLAISLSTGIKSFALSTSKFSDESNQGPFESYTYWLDSESNEKEATLSKPMYKVSGVIDGASIGMSPFSSVDDICSDENNNTYLLNGKDSQVLIFDKSYRYISMITSFLHDGSELKFKGARGITVKNNKIYVADTLNARVIISDLVGNVEKILTLPDSRLIPSGFDYKPIKVAVDTTNTIYVASDGSFYGAIVYSPENEFMGFYGANTVPASLSTVLQTLFDKLFSNDIKKGSTVLSLPYQINDLVAGPDDFIYTASTGNSNGYSKGQVHVLSPGGGDIMGKDGFNFADKKVTNYNQKSQFQSIGSIDVDPDGFFYILDSKYGRIFWYDKNCNLLSVFGGSVGNGTQKGTFINSVAIAINGSDILIADNAGKSFTVFSMTEYGALVREAQLKTLSGEFKSVETKWKEIAKQDANSQLAYSGLAKIELSNKNYKMAMHYSKLANDREIYAKAFEGQRSKFALKWFGLLVGLTVVLIGFIVWLLHYKRKKNIKLIRNEKVKIMTESIFHPFRSFGTMKEKKLSSTAIATVILVLFYIVTAISDVSFGFAYNSFNANTYNSFYMFLRTIGLVSLWVISNWLVCVLLGGIGKFKEIYSVTCYSLIPIIFSTLLAMILSHILVPDEFVFVTLFSSICTFYSFFLIAVGTMKVHDYSFGKFLGTTALSIISMMIILFLIFLIFLLAQQVYAWIVIVVGEISL